MSFLKSPVALFDNIANINDTKLVGNTVQQKQDHEYALKFLKAYSGSQGTFNSYRRELEKLLQWTCLIAEKTLKELKREDIEEFIRFCQKPPKSWISLQKFPRFVTINGERKQNPKWRPFTTVVAKSARLKGEKPDKKNFKLSPDSIKETFAILSSFYNYLLQEEYILANPVALIRQKSKFIRKNQGSSKIRRLSEQQWKYVLKATTEMAENNPYLHERTLFIITALYAMYLRISELTATTRWLPTMNHFFSR